ncbi:MAG TPA: PEGA domain-containing protein, partial [Steroidobacteraceae bacterium]|nr:PEGA domain-containing protein [Steroidobacteraceae bacterium]
MKAIARARSALCAVAAISLMGCCSIIHGTRQDVGINSSPTGALVKVDNAPSGNTPLVAKLTRKDNHVVHIELSGYQPFDLTLTRSVSGWVWGNIVFGGLIGLAVDAIDGAFYNLTPDQVTATLAANHASVT